MKYNPIPLHLWLLFGFFIASSLWIAYEIIKLWIKQQNDDSKTYKKY